MTIHNGQIAWKVLFENIYRGIIKVNIIYIYTQLIEVARSIMFWTLPSVSQSVSKVYVLHYMYIYNNI